MTDLDYMRVIWKSVKPVIDLIDRSDLPRERILQIRQAAITIVGHQAGKPDYLGEAFDMIAFLEKPFEQTHPGEPVLDTLWLERSIKSQDEARLQVLHDLYGDPVVVDMISAGPELQELREICHHISQSWIACLEGLADEPDNYPNYCKAMETIQNHQPVLDKSYDVAAGSERAVARFYELSMQWSDRLDYFQQLASSAVILVEMQDDIRDFDNPDFDMIAYLQRTPGPEATSFATTSAFVGRKVCRRFFGADLDTIRETHAEEIECLRQCCAAFADVANNVTDVVEIDNRVRAVIGRYGDDWDRLSETASQPEI